MTDEHDPENVRTTTLVFYISSALAGMSILFVHAVSYQSSVEPIPVALGIPEGILAEVATTVVSLGLLMFGFGHLGKICARRSEQAGNVVDEMVNDG